MQQVMLYCVATPNHGLLAPEGQWSGCEDEELVIKMMSDMTYVCDYDTRHSIMGRETFLNSAPIIVRSKMRQYVDLSVRASLSCDPNCRTTCNINVIDKKNLNLGFGNIILVDPNSNRCSDDGFSTDLGQTKS
jgi:hypothetical protein